MDLTQRVCHKTKRDPWDSNKGVDPWKRQKGWKESHIKKIMSNATTVQASRSMFGYSSKNTSPASILPQLKPYITSLLDSLISKGVNTIIGQDSPNAGFFTYLSAVGDGMKSMIWTPSTGTLSVVGTVIQDDVVLGIERIITNIATLSVTKTISLLYLQDVVAPTAILPSGRYDGQVKKIILVTNSDKVQIQGTFAVTKANNSLAMISLIWLRCSGNSIELIWNANQQGWLLCNSTCYIE